MSICRKGRCGAPTKDGSEWCDDHDTELAAARPTSTDLLPPRPPTTSRLARRAVDAYLTSLWHHSPTETQPWSETVAKAETAIQQVLGADLSGHQWTKWIREDWARTIIDGEAFHLRPNLAGDYELYWEPPKRMTLARITSLAQLGEYLTGGAPHVPGGAP